MSFSHRLKDTKILAHCGYVIKQCMEYMVHMVCTNYTILYYKLIEQFSEMLYLRNSFSSRQLPVTQ